MIITNIPVAPMCIRPNITNEGSISRDQLTDQYETILKLVAENSSNSATDRE